VSRISHESSIQYTEPVIRRPTLLAILGGLGFLGLFDLLLGRLGLRRLFGDGLFDGFGLVLVLDRVLALSASKSTISNRTLFGKAYEPICKKPVCETHLFRLGELFELCLFGLVIRRTRSLLLSTPLPLLARALLWLLVDLLGQFVLVFDFHILVLSTSTRSSGFQPFLRVLGNLVGCEEVTLLLLGRSLQVGGDLVLFEGGQFLG
jgi:hypothetical protein